MKPLHQKYAMGYRLVSWPSVLWLAKPPLVLVWTSAACAPVVIVNNGVVYIAYQCEQSIDWDPENIIEEDHAEPVQAWL